MAAAVGVGAGLALLGTSGYVPNVRQSETVVLYLRILYALVPCLCNAAAIVIAFAYPITGSVHRNIRDAIDRRSTGEPVPDPLEPSRMLR
jgi:GPH family glycoside/pentoside/hexuronide:cation symporter